MIKVLIADDDYEVLTGLENIIDWQAQGFEISGKAEDGIEAMQIGSRLLPDIIITDITMSEMNGLELIREMKKIKPSVKTVLITCHEDFKMAKEAITLNVDEYLVKYTLTRERLLDVLEKLKAKIEAEKDRKESLNRLSNEMHINKNIIKEKLLSDIIEGRIKKSEIIDGKAKLYGIGMPDNAFRAIGLFIDNYGQALKNSTIEEDELITFSIINIFEDIFQMMDNISIFPYRNNFILLYWDTSSDIHIKQILLDLLGNFKHTVEEILNIPLSICIGGVTQSILNMKNAYEMVTELRASYFYQASGQIVVQKMLFNLLNTNELYKLYSDSFKLGLENGNKENMELYIAGMCDTIASQKYLPDNVKALFSRFTTDIDVAVRKYDRNMEKVQFDGDTFDDCKQKLSNVIEDYFKIIREAGTVNLSDDIRKIVEYINRHLDQDISLETAAAYVHKNSNHLSRIFKRDMGISFSEYLIKRRMEKATALLTDTAIPVEEISKLIGIDNIHYFYRTFKKEMGKTPGEIRGGKKARQHGII